MAVTDAYATAAEYRARVTKNDTADDATIDTQLKAVSRYLDKAAGRFFTIDASAVARVYDGRDSRVLWIDDVGDKTGIAVKVDTSGNWLFTESGETLTENTHYWVGPRNAGLGAEPEPYRFLELIPNNGVLSAWTRWVTHYNAGWSDPYTGLVEVTAKFGWPAVPGAIKEWTIAVVRQVRDIQESGQMAELQAIDNIIETSRELSSRLRDIVRQYGRQELFA